MKYLFILFSMLVMTSLMAQEEIVIELSQPNAPAQLEIGINKGDIIVKGTNRKDILVRYKTKNSDDLKMVDAGNGLKKISGARPGLEITEEDNEVEISTTHWSNRIELYVEVPYQINLEANTMMEGKVEVDNLSGELELENANGPVKASNISGVLQANSFNGSVEVDFKKVKPDTPMSFVSYNGQVDVSLPGNTKFDLKAKSDHGDIYTGFDMQLKSKKVKSKDNEKTTYTDSWVRSSVNGGGPEFTLMTYHGNIFIRKKE
ncbi:MAG: DUF4097 domain-containing protein [Saprospiraceae bacterium]|nr:DUF4097 domain-containing protein [Saprospiraceae bacterium]